MAKTVRIDKIVRSAPGGPLHVYYTVGQEPLPLRRGKTALEFNDLDYLKDFVRGGIESISENSLIALALEAWLRTDRDARTLAGAEGKTTRWDSTAATPIVVA